MTYPNNAHKHSPIRGCITSSRFDARTNKSMVGSIPQGLSSFRVNPLRCHFHCVANARWGTLELTQPKNYLGEWKHQNRRPSVKATTLLIDHFENSHRQSSPDTFCGRSSHPVISQITANYFGQGKAPSTHTKCAWITSTNNVTHLEFLKQKNSYKHPQGSLKFTELSNAH